MRKKFDLSYRLFLDDIRIPTDVVNYISSSIANEYRIFDWKIARNYDDFVNHIEVYGLPTHISFDHDLALEHYTPEEYWNDYNKSKIYQNSKSYTEKTGADCAKWLCEYLVETNQKMPVWYVHSQNPVGADNIKSILNTYKKIYDPENI